VEAVTLGESPAWVNPHLDKWDFRFIRLAEEVASWSKDPKRKVGCVISHGKRDVAKGYNGFPHSLSDDLNRLRSPAYKDKVIIHAELNAIVNASKFGVSLENATAYVTLHPCTRCSSLLVQSGIVKIVCPPPLVPESSKWYDDFKMSSDLLFEAGLTVLYY
jgi:dCMP deaminase